MASVETPPQTAEPAGIRQWFARHWAPLMLGVMLLVALPFYLDAAAIQLLDNEFFASLCSIVGWGKGGG